MDKNKIKEPNFFKRLGTALINNISAIFLGFETIFIITFLCLLMLGTPFAIVMSFENKSFVPIITLVLLLILNKSIIDAL